jgi:hypothetical protein
MGFALWIENGVARAEGTHEYRPMGVAVISATSQFAARDFRPGRDRQRRPSEGFAGFFGSLIEVNAHLRSRRELRREAASSHPALPYF